MNEDFASFFTRIFCRKYKKNKIGSSLHAILKYCQVDKTERIHLIKEGKAPRIADPFRCFVDTIIH